MEEFKVSEDIYGELRLLGQQYRHYMKLHVTSLHELTHLLDYTMPGIKTMLASWNEGNRKDKLSAVIRNSKKTSFFFSLLVLLLIFLILVFDSSISPMYIILFNFLFINSH